eukprot:scpid42755/ scgid27945/ Tripartite motif-containing protein 45; RING finger protein 99
MPHPVCVFCNGGRYHAKALECLHTICLKCLVSRVDGQGNIECIECSKITTSAPPHGMQYVHTLPSVGLPAAGDDDSGGDGIRLSSSQRDIAVDGACCDECLTDEEEASMVCYSCGSHMCELHGKCHRVSKKTHHHYVRSIRSIAATADGSAAAAAGLDRAAADIQYCPVHIFNPLKFYCDECKRLLCDKCCTRREHLQHGKSATHTIPVAAARAREEIDSRIQDVFKAGDIVCSCPDNTKSPSCSLHGNKVDRYATQMQEDIKKWSDFLETSLEERKSKLLSQVADLEKSQKLKIDMEKLSLETSRHYLETVRILLAVCDDLELVRLGESIEEALEQVQKFFDKVAPMPWTDFRFQDTGFKEASDAINESGQIVTCLDAAAVYCLKPDPHYTGYLVHEKLTIPVEVVDVDKKRVEKAVFQSSVIALKPACDGHSKDGEKCENCSPLDCSRREDREETEDAVGHFTFQSSQPGSYALRPWLNSKAFDGFTMHVGALVPCVFQQDMCGTSIQLTNNMHTAQLKNSNSSGVVCIRPLSSDSGAVDILRFQINNFPHQSNLFILLSDPAIVKATAADKKKRGSAKLPRSYGFCCGASTKGLTNSTVTALTGEIPPTTPLHVRVVYHHDQQYLGAAIEGTDIAGRVDNVVVKSGMHWCVRMGYVETRVTLCNTLP